MLEVETEASFGNKTPTTIAKREEQMKIQVLFALLSSALASVLSGAGICTAYAQGGQVREIGLPATGGSSDTSVNASTQVQLPIRITEPGNYRLNTNLVGALMPVIRIESSAVTLDLNGFSVTGLGNVIVANGSNIAILNGTVSNLDDQAISISGPNCRVEGLRTSGGRDGISVSNCIVKNNTVQAAHTGILCQTGCVVSGNTVSTVLDVAIGATDSSLVVGNTATSAADVALHADDTTGYAQNVLHGGPLTGDVTGGVQIGQNLCVTSKICLP